LVLQSRHLKKWPFVLTGSHKNLLRNLSLWFGEFPILSSLVLLPDYCYNGAGSPHRKPFGVSGGEFPERYFLIAISGYKM
jgi:hypothetical protein